MSFGGGSGFSPSRTIVEASTKTGNDAAQKHQFTGSVEISGGPLKLNGASITGGGGGTPGGSDTQIQYNDGGAFGGASGLIYNDANNRVGIGVAAPSALLHLSASDASDPFRVDTTDRTDNPAIFVKGATSLVGIGCSDPEQKLEVREDTDNEDVFIQVRGDGGGTGYAGFKAVRNIGNAEFKLKNDGTIPRLEIATARIAAFPRPRIELSPGGNAVLKALYDEGIQVTGSVQVETDNPVQFRDTATKINSPSANVLTLTGPTVDVAGTFSLNSSNVTSTAPELNLLDASTVTAPSEGIWAGVERVAVMDIGASEYAVDSHTLGVTIPDKAIITRAIIDVGTAFTTSDAPTLGLFTTGNIFPSPGEGAAPIDFFASLGASPNAPFQLISAVNSRVLQFTGGKLNGASTITFQVAVAALTAGAAKVYIYYIMGS